MDVSVVVAFACAVLAAASTGVLVGRCIRVPRMDIIAWSGAVAAIAVALGAQALGAHNGFTSSTFRAVQIGAQLIAPLWLAWGLAELAAKGVAARFGAKLVTAAVTVVGGVVLITDPLNSSTAFSKSWPVAPDHYQIIPRSLLSFVAGLVILTVVIILIVALVRLHSDRDGVNRLIAIAPVAVAAVALFGLRFNLSSSEAYPALCAVCAILAAFAGIRAAKIEVAGEQFADDPYDGEPPGYSGPRGHRPGPERRPEPERRRSRPAAAQAGGPPWRDAPGPDQGTWRDPANTGQATQRSGVPPWRDTVSTTQSNERFGAAHAGQAENGDQRAQRDDDWYRLDRANQANDANQADSGYPPDGGYPQDGGDGMNGLRRVGRKSRLDDGYEPGADIDRDDAAGGDPDAGRTGVWQPRTLGTDTALAAPGASFGSQPAPGGNNGMIGDESATQRLYGLIAIYTLAEGREAEFDALAEKVVTEVRASEPDALVYAVHSVPNAPMQRIFYEVYRDRTAFEEHKRHLYIQRFDVERGPYVLATNVIELGTQQAKLSPLPGLSQLLHRSPGG
ncbi:MAG TPA: antibiotic biosynthesis monooxygenase [Streptosporangiaceae bacterium]|jgi:quinol monooxygenase YgiN